MKQNLDVLKTEIQEYLEHSGLAVFYGYSRTLDPLAIVMWDVEQHPDYRDFLKVGLAAGAKIVVLHTRTFLADFVDNAVEDLEDGDLPAEERRNLERRLRDLRAYDGFTCAVEISFDIGDRAYIFELRTEWYEEFSDLLADIDMAAPDDDDDDDTGEGHIGGFFSRN